MMDDVSDDRRTLWHLPRWMRYAHVIRHQVAMVDETEFVISCYEEEYEDLRVALHALGLQDGVHVLIHINPPLHVMLMNGIPPTWLRRN